MATLVTMFVAILDWSSSRSWGSGFWSSCWCAAADALPIILVGWATNAASVVGARGAAEAIEVVV